MHFFVRCLLFIVFIALNRLRKMVILVCVTCKVSVHQGTFSVDFYRFWVFYIFLSGHSVALQTKMTTFHSISPFKLLHGAFKAHATGVIHKESIELRVKADFLSILTKLKKLLTHCAAGNFITLTTAESIQNREMLRPCLTKY